jgi:hypothetical protein
MLANAERAPGFTREPTIRRLKVCPAVRSAV